MAKFSAGQMVVCIDASDTGGELICGEVYEVMLRGVDYYDHCVKIVGSSHWNEARFTLFEDKKEVMNNNTKTPHIHAEMIIAWAGGAEIEFYSEAYDKWEYSVNPAWNKTWQYRVKPEQMFPCTTMLPKDIIEIYNNSTVHFTALVDIANTAIKHFIISGDMDKYIESNK